MVGWRGVLRMPPCPPMRSPSFTLQRAYSHILWPQRVHVGLGQQRYFIIRVWIEVGPDPAGGIPWQLLASCG